MTGRLAVRFCRRSASFYVIAVRSSFGYGDPAGETAGTFPLTSKGGTQASAGGVEGRVRALRRNSCGQATGACALSRAARGKQPSKEQFQRQLDRPAGVQCRPNLAARGCVDSRRGRCKRRRVRDVEELCPELQRFRFGELELLGHREVELHQTIRAQNVSAGGSIVIL